MGYQKALSQAVLSPRDFNMHLICGYKHIELYICPYYWMLFIATDNM